MGLQIDSEKRQRANPALMFNVLMKETKEDGRNAFIIEQDDDGVLAVWERPWSDMEYRIGCDVSEG